MSDINLIPPARRARRDFEHKLRFWMRAGAAYVVLLGATVGSAYALWAGDDAAVAARLESTVTRMRRNKDSVITLRKQLALCQAQLQTNETLTHQPDWSRLLWLLADAMGEDVTLRTCRLQTLDENERTVVQLVEAPETTVPTDRVLSNRDYRLSLAGYARTQTAVSLFVLRLERLELFGAVRLGKARREDFAGGPAVSFVIECDF